ncbi:Gfo/Idh/MocA family oxidoreductase, partial [Candidatus Pelagibacter ubique]|nr:Gfo/Idh/MocA family oxidoreductase [Candidatus Pelagibacter ubique]
MKTILIFGYGSWAKKIIRYLKASKNFKEIYVKTSFKFFTIYPQKKNINLSLFEIYLKKLDIIHICVPTEKHFKIIKINKLYDKKLIVEKPLVKKINELRNIKHYFKKNKLIVNYIDLYNPNLLNIKNDLQKIINIDFYYGNKKQYNNKYECLNEWLDHPLSIVLFLFKRFSKFKVISFKVRGEKGKYFEQLKLNYKFRNKNINIMLNTNYPKSQRSIDVTNNIKVIKYKFNQVKRKNEFLKGNNLKFLYKDINKKETKFYQKYDFHKNLFL